MTIKVTYNNYTVVKYDNFDEITNNMNVIMIDCNDNNVTSLPDNMNMMFSNLIYFNCSSCNKLPSLPPNMMFPKLKYFFCNYNKLTSLPDNMMFPNLTDFDCSDNNLKSLPPNMMFPNLIHFNCSYNNLYYIPPHINCYVDKDDNTKSPEYMRRKLLI